MHLGLMDPQNCNLSSGHMDLFANKSVLGFHGPIVLMDVLCKDQDISTFCMSQKNKQTCPKK